MAQNLDPHGLISCKQPNPVSDHLDLTFWVVAQVGLTVRVLMQSILKNAVQVSKIRNPKHKEYNGMHYQPQQSL